MKMIGQAYEDLRFTPEQLYFSDAEYKIIAQDFFAAAPETLTNRDRAFLQAALFIAIDKSEKAGFVFEMFKSFVSAAPSQSVTKLLKKLASSGAKYAFKRYIDNDPKYSAVGKAGVQYSPFATEWKMRVSMGDAGNLTNFLKYGS